MTWLFLFNIRLGSTWRDSSFPTIFYGGHLVCSTLWPHLLTSESFGERFRKVICQSRQQKPFLILFIYLELRLETQWWAVAISLEVYVGSQHTIREHSQQWADRSLFTKHPDKNTNYHRLCTMQGWHKYTFQHSTIKCHQTQTSDSALSWWSSWLVAIVFQALGIRIGRTNSDKQEACHAS